MHSTKEEIKQEKSSRDLSVRLHASQGKGLWFKHWHRSIEICQVRAGEYQFIVGKQRFVAQKGDIVLVPGGQLHQLGSHSTAANMLICQFNEKLLCNLVNDLYCIKTHITLQQMQQLGVADEIGALMDRIQEEFMLQQAEYRSLIQADLIRLCCLFLRYFKTDSQREKKDLGRLAMVQAICEYIAQNYTNDISLKNLAEATNYSCSYISSIFAGVAGVPVKEYLENYRINKVITCIQETGCSYSAAAAQCGFNSIRTFNNAFKRVTGKTPSDYFDSEN